MQSINNELLLNNFLYCFFFTLSFGSPGFYDFFLISGYYKYFSMFTHFGDLRIIFVEKFSILFFFTLKSNKNKWPLFECLIE